MNLLLDRVPTSVEIAGKEYAIRWDFRIMVMFEMLIQDTALSANDRFYQGLNLFYPELPDDVDAAADFLLLFYRGGKEDVRPEKTKQSGKDSRIYSFDEDDELIFAAFLGQYAINLNTVQSLHWWEFRALFCALQENCEFVKVMGYRSIKLTSSMSREQKEFYRRMKKRYALPLPQNEKEKLNAIELALLGSGDLCGLL